MCCCLRIAAVEATLFSLPSGAAEYMEGVVLLWAACVSQQLSCCCHDLSEQYCGPQGFCLVGGLRSAAGHRLLQESQTAVSCSLQMTCPAGSHILIYAQ